MKGAELSDLLVDDFSAVLNEDISNEPYYEIVHNVLNSILSVECPEVVRDAATHHNNLVMLYSENENFANPQEVGNKEVAINQTTEANKTYDMDSEIEFSMDGYYAIAYELDYDEQIEERNEANNAGENEVVETAGRKKSYWFSKDQVFQVKNSMRAGKGDGKYYRRWTVKISD